MSRPTPFPAATDESDSLDGWERALLDRQLEALGRLADMGMAIAAAIERRVTADEPSPDAAQHLAAQHHLAMDFARVSRAVRMTYALQSRLIADFKGGARRADAAKDDSGPIEIRWASSLEDRDEEQRREVPGIVRRLAEGASPDRETAERLACEARERLERDDIHRELTTRPLGEVVALICKDLGLEPDWDLIAGEDWARAEIVRRPPGSPFAEGMAGRAHAPPLVPSG